jgi:hypothetical protein
MAAPARKGCERRRLTAILGQWLIGCPSAVGFQDMAGDHHFHHFAGALGDAEAALLADARILRVCKS